MCNRDGPTNDTHGAYVLDRSVPRSIRKDGIPGFKTSSDDKSMHYSQDGSFSEKEQDLPTHVVYHARPSTQLESKTKTRDDACAHKDAHAPE